MHGALSPVAHLQACNMSLKQRPERCDRSRISPRDRARDTMTGLAGPRVLVRQWFLRIITYPCG
jgi:hypothetical protein